MAKVSAVWGIDIGHCALKAICCHLDEKQPGKIVASAFDYIEYPKITTQAEADAVELVREALATFLERNELRKAKVAVSVSGQSGLARFIKLPPVETKKIPDIVRYEANQQIPFDLDEVIWDYQRMFGGNEEEGFALETEVGLFAMKRDQVYEEIEHYLATKIDIDIVQLAPLAIYNFLIFDQIGQLPPEDEFDPEDPPESVVGLSIGTENSDLVITNGFRVWQRSIPLGGSHFTKALVKELQETYAGAEELKRRATEAADPKALYQAMRPVFKDLLTEIQRSIGYFHSLDRAAKIGRVLAMGNSMKLPGLKRYLSQNLGQEVEQLESMNQLTGSAVIASPSFQDNILSFPIAYGLAIQGLETARLNTNLVPVELVRDRAINRKKPWAVAASILLALGCLLNFLLLWWPWSKVRIEDDERWKTATSAVQTVDEQIKSNETAFAEAQQTYHHKVGLGDTILAHYDRRDNWLNLLRAVDQCLPQNQGVRASAAAARRPASDDTPPTAGQLMESEKIWLTSMTTRHVDDLAVWYSDEIEEKYQKHEEGIQLKIEESDAAKKEKNAWADILSPEEAQAQAKAQGTNKNQLMPMQARYAATEKPGGPGYIVQLAGYHYHNSRKYASDDHFVRRTLVHNLQNKNILLPDSNGRQEPVSVQQLGISHPLVLKWDQPAKVLLPKPPGMGDDEKNEATQYRFVVQFAWQPQPPTDSPPTTQVATTQTAP
ncbi:MAG: pilus assembly protein PilM [Planctomycetales bacterium]|nr:pilus assembly protein PilM [Planctomycetales bacterium]NIM08008.1 pilus assembly protein PilM [Planctomycetales bacterium]NIN07490.1 pilus assembly protein PilM [Planctomycetales bacterium]NIN76595.1 pilus assembly protein PilM [Planctomycetales bacterium]NIO33785.1 pilus assembly protein PilM [Planctomycetales bacterium]